LCSARRDRSHIPTAEIRWLLASLRSLDDQEAPSPPTTLSWDHLLSVADAEGLAPALGFALKAKAPAAVPLAVREQLKRRLADGIAGQLILAASWANSFSASSASESR